MFTATHPQNTCSVLLSYLQVIHSAQSVQHTVTNMEGRLLELSRQSAAARSKLLELIDQQRQNSSMLVSPCISPIPVCSESPATGVCVFVCVREWVPLCIVSDAGAREASETRLCSPHCPRKSSVFGFFHGLCSYLLHNADLTEAY